jgi:hypothetical protein
MLRLAGMDGSVAETGETNVELSLSLEVVLVFNGEAKLEDNASEALACRLTGGVRAVPDVGTDIRDSVIGLGSLIIVAGGCEGSSFEGIKGAVCGIFGRYDLGAEEIGGYEGGPRGAIRVYTSQISFKP